MTQTSIADRFNNVREQIQHACDSAKRPSDQVTLLAVSKTKPVEAISAAYQQGQRCFGENYVQEGVEKVQQLAQYRDIEWHFIGALQSNKTKVVAEHFDWVQSVASVKVAQRLSKQRPAEKAPLQLCLQVNIDQEASKSGLSLQQLPELAAAVDALPNVTLRGVMAIPSKTDDPEQQLASFLRLQQAFLQLQQQYSSVDTLSMGMSGDLDAAIQAGSTMVRIGTALFGARQ